MSAPALTLDELKALQPCDDSFRRVSRLLGGEAKWDGNKIDAAAARAAGATFDDIVWVASAVARQDKDVERRLRLWMADCAARVLHIYEAAGDSPAPREAIIAARQFARGEIDDAAWAARAASEAAGEAAWAAAGDAARAAGAAAKAAAWAAARDAAWAVAWAAARDAAWAATWDAGAAGAAGAAAWDTEEVWQFDRLIAWLSAEEPEDWPLPARVEP